MKQYVLVTGTGRPMALGFNFVLRYLEQGADVIATVRKPSTRCTFWKWTWAAPPP